MTTDDIDQAFRVLNIEPLYGHSPHNPPTFRRAIPYPPSSTTGTLYFVEDEEIDFDRVLREEKITLPKPVSWTAHWLAVEGVQPLIPENPPAITKDAEEPSALKSITGQPSTSALTTQPTTKGRQQNQQLVKQVLSRELQLYYARLTSSLLPPAPEDYVKRTAALASLRHDAGLQALLPYLVRWVAEGVVNTLRAGVQTETDGRVLEVLLDVISALLDNSTLFVEPYVRFVRACLPSLTRYVPVTPNASPSLVHPPAFIITVHPLDTSAYLGGTDDVAPPNTTFHNVSFFGPPYHEDTTFGTGFDRQESRDPRRCHPWSRGRWQGRNSEGAYRRTWCKSCRSGESDTGLQFISRNCDGVFLSLPTRAYTLTRDLASIGRVCHTFSPIEVACAFEHCRSQRRRGHQEAPRQCG